MSQPTGDAVIRARNNTYDDDFRFISDFTRMIPEETANRIRKCVYMVMIDEDGECEIGNNTHAGHLDMSEIGMVMLCCGVLQRTNHSFIREKFKTVRITDCDTNNFVLMECDKVSMSGMLQKPIYLALRKFLCGVALSIEEVLESGQSDRVLPTMVPTIERLEETAEAIFGNQHYIAETVMKTLKALCIDRFACVRGVMEALK